MIEVAPEVRSYVRLDALAFAPVLVRPADPALAAELERAAAEARTRLAGQDLARLPRLHDVRAMYHATGTDPTRRRPASEALLRRALQGKPLPQVNTLVDCVNLFSLRELVPVGLYDADRIQGRICCRLGRTGEPYTAIGREAFSVEGRLVLSDDLGPFGSPTSDSTRTMVTLETTRALAVIFWPASRADASSRLLRELVDRYCCPPSSQPA